MYTHFYQNSIIIFIISLILLSLIFYIFKIGYTIKIVDGKIIKSFSIIYPLAISLIVWVIWHFVLYPPNSSDHDDYHVPQKINMELWK